VITTKKAHKLMFFGVISVNCVHILTWGEMDALC